MAVYKRTYKGYDGGLTPQWSRFMILPRYSYARLFQSKFLLMFLAVCALYPIGATGVLFVERKQFKRALLTFPERLHLCPSALHAALFQDGRFQLDRKSIV